MPFLRRKSSPAAAPVAAAPIADGQPTLVLPRPGRTIGPVAADRQRDDALAMSSPRQARSVGAHQPAAGLGEGAGERRVDRERVRQVGDGQGVLTARAIGSTSSQAPGATTTPPSTMPVPGGRTA